MKTVWSKWKETAAKIGNFQATVIFSLLYFILITPFGLIFKLTKDPFLSNEFPTWSDLEDDCSTLEKMKLQ